MIEQLKSLQKRSGLTAAQWASESGVPTDTINKILNGTTKSPGFQTICSLIIAAGGSVDELLGIKAAVEQKDGEIDVSVLNAIRDTYESKIIDLKEYHAQHIETKDSQIADLLRTRRIVSIALAAVVIFVFGILIFDLLNGGVGYVRY